jgi:hypothetical protein
VTDRVVVYDEGKAYINVSLYRPEGSRSLRLPDFMPFGTLRWLGCQPYAPAAFTSQEIVPVFIYISG